MKNWIQSAVTGLLLERPGQKRTIDEHATALDRLGMELQALYAAAPDTPANREQLRHIIAIERWGQRRLRVFLGEPPDDEDSNAYRPPADLDWETLQTLFAETRAETVRLATALAQAQPDPSATVTHNQYGKLTVLGWLHYLGAHASLESKRIR